MTLPKLPVNDGWQNLEYDLGVDPHDGARISRVLNEATHVFHHHKEGVWASQDRDAYARLLADEIALRAGLVGRLLNTDDRVVKMVTYRAVELLKADQVP